MNYVKRVMLHTLKHFEQRGCKSFGLSGSRAYLHKPLQGSLCFNEYNGMSAKGFESTLLTCNCLVEPSSIPWLYCRWTKYSNPGQFYPPRPQISKLFSSSKGLDGWTKEMDPSSMTCHTRRLTLTFGDGGAAPTSCPGLNILSIYGMMMLFLQSRARESSFRCTLSLASFSVVGHASEREELGTTA